MDRALPIPAATVHIETSGFMDGPAQALRDHLLRNGVHRLTMVQHPLGPEERNGHLVTTWHDGSIFGRRRIRLPHFPPWTYPLDLFTRAGHGPAADVWFGFNVLAAARGLAARRRGAASRVVQWCVDFVPDRFGNGMTTRAYDALDSFVCRHADARFELSEVGRDARNRRHGLVPGRCAPVSIVPMGAWLEETPRTRPELGAAWRLVYLGHLVERQGVSTLLAATARLADAGRPVELDVVGHGPLADRLKGEADELGLGQRVRFHGFVEDPAVIGQILASGTVGCAPYRDDVDSFTQYADPGKLKAYLGAGLPIVTTAVAPIAGDLAAHAGAEIVSGTAESLAAGLDAIHRSETEWQRRRSSAIAFSRQFDWPSILAEPLADVGLVGPAEL